MYAFTGDGSDERKTTEKNPAEMVLGGSTTLLFPAV